MNDFVDFQHVRRRVGDRGAFLAARDQVRRGRFHHEGCAFDLRRQRKDVRLARGVLGPSERGARCFRLQAPNRDSATASSPSCAIAMPRSASAGASAREATRFKAPRGALEE